jgi:histone-lysine N-methyltransferase MLL2
MVGGVTTPPLLDEDEPLDEELLLPDEELLLLDEDAPPEDELLDDVVPPEEELLDEIPPEDELLLEEDDELPEEELLLLDEDDELPDDELLLEEEPLGGGEPPPPPPPHAARVSVEMTVSDVNNALSCTGTLVSSLTRIYRVADSNRGSRLFRCCGLCTTTLAMEGRCTREHGKNCRTVRTFTVAVVIS